MYSTSSQPISFRSMKSPIIMKSKSKFKKSSITHVKEDTGSLLFWFEGAIWKSLWQFPAHMLQEPSRRCQFPILLWNFVDVSIMSSSTKSFQEPMPEQAASCHFALKRPLWLGWDCLKYNDGNFLGIWNLVGESTIRTYTKKKKTQDTCLKRHRKPTMLACNGNFRRIFCYTYLQKLLPNLNHNYEADGRCWL